jgi:cytochrome c oxidase subunit 2
MPISVEVVPPEKFAEWIASKGGTMPGQKPAVAASAPGAAPEGAKPAPAPAAAPANATPAAAQPAAR